MYHDVYDADNIRSIFQELKTPQQKSEANDTWTSLWKTRNITRYSASASTCMRVDKTVGEKIATGDSSRSSSFADQVIPSDCLLKMRRQQTVLIVFGSHVRTYHHSLQPVVQALSDWPFIKY